MPAITKRKILSLYTYVEASRAQKVEVSELVMGQ